VAKAIKESRTKTDNSSSTQSDLTKEASMITTLICVGGIWCSYLAYGYVQELMFFGETTDKILKLQFTAALIGIHCFMAYVFALIVNTFIRPRPAVNDSHALTSTETNYLGVYHALTMLCSNSALIFVNYPTQALAKACKLLPVLIVGLIYRKKYAFQRYVCGFLVTVGILIFNSKRIQQDGAEDNSTIGLLLLFGSLLSDGFLCTFQQTLRERKFPNAYDLMEASNKKATMVCGFMFAVVAAAGMYYTQDLSYHYTFTTEDATHAFALALCGAAGQLFIFYTIQTFGPLFLTIVTTTRKFFTVIFSILIYGHSFKSHQKLAFLVVVGAIVFDIVYTHRLKHQKQKPKKA